MNHDDILAQVRRDRTKSYDTYHAVSGAIDATRSKCRHSISTQKLRAAALLAEWFRIRLRMGYVGNHARRNHQRAKRRESGGKRMLAIIRYRQKHRLDPPIGPAAAHLMNGSPLTSSGAPPP